MEHSQRELVTGAADPGAGDRLRTTHPSIQSMARRSAGRESRDPASPRALRRAATFAPVLPMAAFVAQQPRLGMAGRAPRRGAVGLFPGGFDAP